jgi:PAS domain S-box-containing protein
MGKAGILIVEDSFIVAYHLQCTLEAEGYNVLGKCDSGEAAITFMQTSKPDLVLMDIMLAGKMDGIVAAGIIKNTFNAPVIYITALTDKDTIGRAKLTEPYGYLTKPFEDREIFTVIEMALYKHDIESRLRQSEEKYFSTVNSISDCVVAINRDYCISYMNPSAVAITQWSLSEAVDRPVMEVMNLRNESTQEMSVNPAQCAIGMGNLNQMPDDLVLTGRQGVEAPVGESSLSPLLDNKGNFAGLIIVFKNMTEKKERENLIEELKRGKMAGLIEGQEKERGRIAKDLHDGLGQILNAIKMNISMIVGDQEEANNVAKLLDEAIQESVRISENLLPAKLKDFDLSVCLRSLCKTIEKSTQVSLNFAAHGADCNLSQPQKINFYRIAQEAINNAIKHSNAKIITVQLNSDSDSIRMSIEDNGIGIPHERPFTFNRQNGLTNMRDRAEIMGGKLTIESDEQRGTLVIAEVTKLKLALHEQS